MPDPISSAAYARCGADKVRVECELSGELLTWWRPERQGNGPDVAVNETRARVPRMQEPAAMWPKRQPSPIPREERVESGRRVASACRKTWDRSTGRTILTNCTGGATPTASVLAGASLRVECKPLYRNVCANGMVKSLLVQLHNLGSRRVSSGLERGGRMRRNFGEAELKRSTEKAGS